MAISKMAKVLIAGHLAEFDALADELQHLAIFHPTELTETSISEKVSVFSPGSAVPAHSDLFRRLEEVRVFLERYRSRESLVHTLFKPPLLVKREEYQDITKTFSPYQVIESSDQIRNRIDSLKREEERLLQENMNLEPWKDVPISLREISLVKEVRFVIGKMANDRLNDILRLDDVEIEVLHRYSKKTIILIVFRIDEGLGVIELLKKLGFEEMSITGIDCSPQEKYEKNLQRINEIAEETKKLSKEARGLLKDFDRLRILLAYYSNLQTKESLFDYWIRTKNAFVISGWVRREDIEILKSLCASYETVQYEEIGLTRDESPPISFENPKIFAPFQLITRLYNYPSYQSLDPSPAVSIFFAVLFGLCITDAGYGVILALLALLGLRMLKDGRELMWIVFWGGVFTLFAGLITGGIFGDLLRSEDPFLNLPMLAALREKMLWFDSMREPMVFFRLVLLLGLIQVVVGLIMGFFGDLRQGKIVDAMVDKGTWLVILGSLVTILFASDMCVKLSLVTSGAPPMDSSVIKPAFWLTLLMALVVVGFGARDEKSLFFRFFIGFLKLIVLGGVFSYLGDILSYVRVMALGMVTAGIAMAVNTIAFMMYDIPGVGILLTIAVLTAGHLFNLAINLLGGFVHTLRLQYVEFFSKFFIGGGRAFRPLAYSEKYAKIIE